MLVYLESAQVDRGAWDACVQAAGRQPYGYSWYLDQVCERWGGLVLGRYEAVFPLPYQQRMGLRRVYTPFFCQQLGVLAAEGSPLPEPQTWLRALPGSFRQVRLAVGGPGWNAQALPPKWKAETRPNYVLPVDASHEQLRAAYSQNTKRNLRKAISAGLQLSERAAADELLGMIRRYQGPGIPELRQRDYARIGSLMHHALERDQAFMLRCLEPGSSGAVLASTCWLRGPRGPVYLFGSTAPAARQNGAMTLLMDAVIGQYAGQKGLVIDFEGSSLPGLARFYQGFGAVPEPYRVLHMRRFPLIFRGLGAI